MSISINPYKVAIFDAGLTLFYPYPSVADIYHNIAKKYNVHKEVNIISQRFKEAWRDRKQNVNHSIIGKKCSPQDEKLYWKNIVRYVFKDCLKDFVCFDDFFDHLYLEFGSPHYWRIFPEVINVLKTLRQRKISMYIVSNWDSRLRDVCDAFKITSYFKEIFISFEVGYSKPDIRIFNRVLKQVKQFRSNQIIYVGDNPIDDIMCSQAVGFQAIYLNRKGEYLSGVANINSLQEIII